MKMLSVLFRRVFRTEFPCIDKCDTIGLNHTVVADFDGTLLRSRSSFPYFAVLAFEFGGWLRLLGLVVVAPLAGFLYYLVSESAAIQLLVFATFAGVKADEIESVSRAVLPKFYSEDLHSGAWKIFSACGKRYVLTANPRVMVEPFLKEFLGVDTVIGTELASYNGRATGFVKSPGVMVGAAKAEALVSACGCNGMPDVGLGDRASHYPFLRLCKEGYMVPTSPAVEAVSRDKLQKAVIFHDGRLVKAPTLLGALILVVWIPVGFLLACIRIAAGALLPMSIVYYAFWALGVKVFIKGNCPSGSKSKGVLFVCTHKTLLDPIFVSVALKRPVSAVVYSVSRLSEFLSPIKTFRISRDRVKDANMIKRLLQQGDLVICPEGTTCREPFLLRFSALFAELTDQIVPVAVNNKMSMFHGTTARGWKGMDPFFFFMNPSPSYELVFMNQLPLELTCSGGKTSVEVANYIQKLLAGVLKYQCTAYTRKDKYKELAGTDGIVR